MKFDPKIHHRRSIRLKEYDYSGPGAYFVTLVSFSRIKLFGEIHDNTMMLNELGNIVYTSWSQLTDHFNIIHGEWVIMPNHLHAIIWIMDSSRCEASAMPGNNNRIFISADASPLQRPIGTQPGSMGAIIQNFKSVSTRRIHQSYHAQGKGEAFTGINLETVKLREVNASPQRVWQWNYYEHIVRNECELGRIQQYIVGNPFQWSIDEENPDRIG